MRRHPTLMLPMNSDKRDEALDKMRNDPAYTVILVSFKCGSVGLK